MPSYFPIIPVTGYLPFDYFFTLLAYFGLLAWFIAIPIRLVSRA